MRVGCETLDAEYTAWLRTLPRLPFLLYRARRSYWETLNEGNVMRGVPSSVTMQAHAMLPLSLNKAVRFQGKIWRFFPRSLSGIRMPLLPRIGGAAAVTLLVGVVVAAGGAFSAVAAVTIIALAAAAAAVTAAVAFIWQPKQQQKTQKATYRTPALGTFFCPLCNALAQVSGRSGGAGSLS